MAYEYLPTIYKNYLQEKREWYTKKRVTTQVKKLLPFLHQNDFILEIGCGSGMDTQFLKKYGYSVISIDNYKRIANITCKVENLPFKKNLFDAVYMRGVLHLVIHEKALNEIKRVAKRENTIFISYPLNIIANGEEYLLLPDIKEYFMKIFFYKKTLQKHGEHKHYFLEMMGRL